ncbi:inter-alpha-trypsin inhibitor heavy chain H4-like isoform X2 [Megalops cyprinoides]|uniref:inter-alpha-trypsin inhibitor heavy chain H4-like isoform X2 n=1 Tax=Megalops cyprinoides TaxID=118141 RepID=UPI001865012D|nr:inter-alpha-trypsin inhibitor heavy chain H4-like isoform X2 [Megalops cyprinoides]
MVSVGQGVLLFSLLLSSLRGLAGQETSDLDIYSFLIKSEVSSRYAITVITSRVANRANESREVDFHVELPKNAFISKFTMTIDGKAYDGVVKKKEEAQQQYSRAVSRGQSAGLVSAVGRKLEEFRTSVMVAALSKVTFTLTYEELLKRTLGKYKLLIKARPKQPVKHFSIDVQIFEPQGILFVETQGSLTSNDLASAVNTTQSDREVHVHFSPSLQQQQQCFGCQEKGLSGELLVVYDVNRPKSQGDVQVVDGYFVHYFAPSDLTRIPKNVIFIIDHSSSMRGTKIQQTREAMMKILGDLHEDDYFSLIKFNGHVTTWMPALVPVNSHNLEVARKFVEGIKDRGMTNINEAVLKGVQMLSSFLESEAQEGSASIIILLTDGDPTIGVTNLDKIQANVKQAIRNRYSLYCLGFGFDVDYSFLERMALENGGLARRIYEDSDAALQLQGFYEEVASPLLLDVQMNYIGVANVTQTNFSQYYAGSEIVVAGQITDNDLETLTAEVRAKSRDNEVTYHEAFPESDRSLDHYIFKPYIQRLWAYLTVQQLLEREVLLSGEQKKAARERALALSLSYSFVTPLTSMVVTKPEGEDTQVAHKPEEGKRSQGGHVGHQAQLRKQSGLRGHSVQHLYKRLGQSAHAQVHGGQSAPMLKHHDVPILKLRRVLVSNTPPPVTVTRLMPKANLLKVLMPAQGQNTPLCFQIEAPQNFVDTLPKKLVLKVLSDPISGVSINAEMLKGEDFLRVAIHYKDECHIEANSTGIKVTQEGKERFISWTSYAATEHCNGITLALQKEVLEVAAGNMRVDILRHKKSQDSFLWPAIRHQAPIANATGIMGQAPVSYHLKETTPVAKLKILGKEVLGTRDSMVDYSTHTKPTVYCWLVPFSSVVLESLQSVIVSQL